MPLLSELNWGLVLGFLNEALAKPLFYAVVGALTTQAYLTFRKTRNPLVRTIPLKTVDVNTLPFGIRRSMVTVVHGLIPPSAVGLPYYMVEEGDVGALHKTVSLLATIYGRETVDVQNHRDVLSELQNKDNVVCMSGPVWNVATEIYIGLLGCPVRFMLDKDGNLILSVHGPNGETERIETKYIDGRPKTCFGLLLAGRATVSIREQNVVLFAGNSSLSTYGGALFLSNAYRKSALRKMLRGYQLWRQSRWAIIYRVTNWSEGAERQRGTGPIKDGLLDIGIHSVYLDSDFIAPYEYHLR